jgi:hypothetical protein
MTIRQPRRTKGRVCVGEVFRLAGQATINCPSDDIIVNWARTTPNDAGESHMEIFDSFLARNGSIGFESFVPKARRILKLPNEALGKPYAIALPNDGGLRLLPL